jgi:hypothetical protein
MTSLKAAVEDLLNNRQLTVQQAVDRHFAPSFRQRTNGIWEDPVAFEAKITQYRKIVKFATITVLDELVDGTRYAERHVVDLIKSDDERVVQEVYVFAERDGDGRFVRIEESTLKLER